MAIKTLFIPLDQAESTSEIQNIRDRYDRFKEKTKEFDSRQIDKINRGEVAVMSTLDDYLNPFDLRSNPNGGYSIVSVTPVLGTETEKVDKDEPMLPLVHTTGFMVILHKAD
tara:strand:+ start:2096 stop:2431 length:336 start_codon:yes stop_codon:yes gene_type:complete